jgi:RNA polymerase sigma-70 factor (ECF subfamily)
MASTVLSAGSPALRSRRLDGRHLAGHLGHLERAARALCAGDRRGDGDAEDLVQETLERVLRRPRVVTGDPGLYLLQALRHTYLDRRRAQRSRVRAVPQPADFDAPDPRASEDLALRVEAREVLAAIRDLPRPYREAVLMLDVAGYTAREAAARLGVPQGTLDSRAFRGRARVLAAVAAEDPPPAAASGPSASPSSSHGCRRRPSRSPGR